MTLSLPAALEALLFASGEPISTKRLLELLQVSEPMLDEACKELDTALTARGLTLMRTENMLELRTSAEASDLVLKLRESERSRDLGKASLEALSVVLYQNGATRGEIDWVRGVNSSAAIRSLMLRGLIEKKEDPEDKRRARYTATMDALAHLGISSVKDLPRHAELTAALKEESEKVESSEETG
jgi:segregation and condensation protein B